MRSELFEDANLEVEGRRFALQNPQLLRVALGDDVLAVKGAMVAYQGQVRFDHEKAGGVGKLLKKMVTNEDMPLMRVSGQGEVFFAKEAGQPRHDGAVHGRHAGGARLLRSAHVRRRAGLRRMVGRAGAERGVEHERRVDAARRLRRGVPVRLPRAGLRRRTAQ